MHTALGEIDLAIVRLERAIEEKTRASRSIAQLRAELLSARDVIESLRAENQTLKDSSAKLGEENEQLIALSNESAAKLDEATSAIESLIAFQNEAGRDL